MRIDKYLKVSRIIKRRTLAKEVLDLGRVYINGKQAKPSSVIKIGDIVDIELKDKQIKFKVLVVDENAKKIDSEFMFEIVSENKIVREI